MIFMVLGKTVSMLSESIQDDELCINNYYVILRLDRNRRGGVLIYVLNTLSHDLLFSGSVELELIVVSVNLPNTKVAIALFYISSSQLIWLYF